MIRSIQPRPRPLRISTVATATICLAVMSLVTAAPCHAAPSFNLTVGQMTTGRQQYAMAVLPSGKVLIAGGIGGISTLEPPVDDSVIYDPQTGVFSPSAGKMSVAREGATATVLLDGRVLIAGGISSTGPLASADLYDPATDSFTPAANTMSVSRSKATATLLADGTVLIAGGVGSSATALASAELFDRGHQQLHSACELDDRGAG